MRSPFQSTAMLQYMHYYTWFILWSKYFVLHYLISDIIHHNDAMGSSVVTGSDGAKPFLSSSIPLRGRNRLEKIVRQKKKKKNGKYIFSRAWTVDDHYSTRMNSHISNCNFCKKFFQKRNKSTGHISSRFIWSWKTNTQLRLKPAHKKNANNNFTIQTTVL